MTLTPEGVIDRDNSAVEEAQTAVKDFFRAEETTDL